MIDRRNYAAFTEDLSGKFPIGITADSVEDVCSQVAHLTDRGIAVVTAKGALMTTERGAFEEFWRAFEISDYFGHGWDALDDLLTDLSWWDDKTGFLLLISEPEKVMIDEPAKRRLILRNVLEFATQEWAKPVEGIVAWYLKTMTPFHTIFCSANIEETHALWGSGLTSLGEFVGHEGGDDP